MRVFVAVAVEAALRKVVAALPQHLNSAAAAFRWVPAGNLHLTLKFLGEIAEERVPRVIGAAQEVGGRATPFSITLGGMGAFPSPRRPQVVWVGIVQGADRLNELARDLDATLSRVEFPKDSRPFRPHLTIARAKQAGPMPDLSGPLRNLRGMVVGAQTVDALLVMQSALNPGGSIYRPVEEVRLGEAS
jgi:RNA 2',3'-cyclic 3'-phosphodiesterase